MSAAFEKSSGAGVALSKVRSQPPDTTIFRIVRADTDLFATFAGLEMQTGVGRDELRRLDLKEYVDNALDACDAAGRGGRVTIQKLDEHRYEITDEGDGIPGTPEELAALFSIHRPMDSTKFWRLPTRGALGNGLRVCVGSVIACGGMIEITTRGQYVALRPTRIDTQVIVAEKVAQTRGTRIVVTFGPDLDEDFDDLEWATAAIDLAELADPAFARKPSPHWQDADQFCEILASIEPPDTTLRAFVERLDGCTGPKGAQIAAYFGKGRTCRSLSPEEGALLLTKLQATARVIKPEALGLLGPGTYGGSAYAKQLGTFEYGSREPHAFIPCAVEAWVQVDNRKGRQASISIFANRTPVIERVRAYRSWHGDRKHPLILSGPGLSESLDLPTGDCSVVLNITAPLIPISSIGKRPNLRVFSSLISEAIHLAFNRGRNLLPPDPEDPKEEPPKPHRLRSHKSLVLEHLAAAIAKTSENGKYGFGLHNLYYKVNEIGRFHELTGKKLSKANFASIITDYEDQHGDVEGMVRDPRGVFMSRSGSFPLGTAATDAYNRPLWEYHKLLYCEKEDLLRILDQAGWWQRHDSAMETAKGYSSRAARDIIDDIADTSEPITVFGLHDADAPGSMIAQTLQEATRARGRRRIEIIDIGLYPWQAIKMGLPVEEISYDKPHPVSELVRSSTETHPITGERVNWGDWLQHHRIELSALTPAKLIEFLDEEVERHGALKVIPPADFAASRLREAVEDRVEAEERDRILRDAEAQIAEAVAERLKAIVLPAGGDLVEQLRETVTENRRRHWSTVIGDIADTLIGGAAE